MKTWFWNTIKKIWGGKQDQLPDIFQISIDEKGEGNKFYSQDKELKYNQGGYYQEFMKFLLNSAGFPEGGTEARKYYVQNYQDAFIDLMDWVCGQPLEVREKFGKVASGQIKAAFKQMQDEGVQELKNTSRILGAFGTLTTTTVGTYIGYVVAAVWAVNDSSGKLPADLIGRTLKLTFNNLGIKYTDGQVLRASNALGKLAYGFYDKEQDIAKFCFFHALTMYKAVASSRSRIGLSNRWRSLSSANPALRLPRRRTKSRPSRSPKQIRSTAMPLRRMPKSPLMMYTPASQKNKKACTAMDRVPMAKSWVLSTCRIPTTTNQYSLPAGTCTALRTSLTASHR